MMIGVMMIECSSILVISNRNATPWKEKRKKRLIYRFIINRFFMSAQKKRTKVNKPTAKPKTTQESKFSLPLIIALVATFLAFSGTFSNDFVNWDDDLNILDNKNLNGFTAENIGRIFHPEHGRIIGNYNPLPIFTFTIQKAIWGLNPAVFHGTNLLLHLLCVFFVFLLGRRLGLSAMGAGLLALLFGIHPMRVESVAWATERKDVLFASFYFGAMLTYTRYLTDKGRKWFVYTIVLFSFSLFSKIQAVSLPLSLLALDYWYKRPLNLKIVLEKAPFFIFSLLFGLMGIYFLGNDGSLEDVTGFGLFDRLLVGAYSYMVYLIKLVFPYELSPLYPYPAKLSTMFYIAPVGVLAVIGGFVYAWKKEWRVVVFGLAFFTFNIMFLLQILAAGQGFIADRFTYVAYLGLFFIVAYGFDFILKNKEKSKTLLYGVMAAVLLLFSVMTFKQVKVWENGLILWTTVTKYYPKTTTPYINMGHYWRDRNDKQKALQYYNEAIDLKANKGTIYNSRGKILLESGRSEAALEDFTKGVTFSPEVGEIHINQGAAYGSLGQYDKALISINKGLALDPENANGYKNRSLLFFLKKDYKNALQDFDNYLNIEPRNANIWQERGQILNIMGDYKNAVLSFNKALEYNPNLKEAYQGRAKAHQNLGNTAAANADLKKAQ